MNPNQRPPAFATSAAPLSEMRILALAPERNSSIFYWGSFDITKAGGSFRVGLLSTLRRKDLCVGGLNSVWESIGSSIASETARAKLVVIR